MYFYYKGDNADQWPIFASFFWIKVPSFSELGNEEKGAEYQLSTLNGLAQSNAMKSFFNVFWN